MTDEWEAPAKLNLSLYVGALDSSGLHPLRSFVTTVEWCDQMTVLESDEDNLEIEGADLPDDEENVIWKALSALRRAAARTEPRLDIRLMKNLPVAAGLAGGSSDAAAALLAAAALGGWQNSLVTSVAAEVGADVPFLLQGGLAVMEGYGDRLTAQPMVDDYAVAIAVPPFELRTADVYRRFDELGEPKGKELSGRHVPPSLRSFDPLRNDLDDAATSLNPELADCKSELIDVWDRPVLMSGSGPALFGFFPDLAEAEDAVAASPKWVRARVAARPRRVGAAPVDR